jgi:hypothetical protein
MAVCASAEVAEQGSSRASSSKIRAYFMRCLLVALITPTVTPVSSIGPETHAQQLMRPYGFDVALVFAPLSSEYAYDSMAQKLG